MADRWLSLPTSCRGSQGGRQETSREKTSFLKFAVTLPVSRCSSRVTSCNLWDEQHSPLGIGWNWAESKDKETRNLHPMYLPCWVIFKMKLVAFNLDCTLDSLRAFMNSDTQTRPPEPSNQNLLGRDPASAFYYLLLVLQVVVVCSQGENNWD